MPNAIKISTKRPLRGKYSELTLGGTTLYGSNEKVLAEFLLRVQQAIEAASIQHPLLIRQVLLAETRKLLDHDLNDRLFGAATGRLLRTGRLRTLLSLSVNSKNVRVIYHSTNKQSIRTMVEIVSEQLRTTGEISTKDVQANHFAGRWGGWYMAQQLCGHLAYVGLAVPLPNDLFRFAKEIEDAVGVAAS